MSPSALLLHCPRNPSLFRLIPRFPSGAKLWLRKFSGGEGRSRAGSPSFPRVLQPPLRRDESLRVVETRHRSVCPDPLRPQVSDQDGDTPVCAPLGEARGLDGVLGPQGCVLASAGPPGQQQVPLVRSFGTGLPVQSSVLRPLHGSAGFHPGHGSGVSFFTSLGHFHPLISRRLAPPGLLSRPCSPCLGFRPLPVSVVGDCDQRGEVEFDSFPTDCISGNAAGFPCFHGFSLPTESGEASLNHRRIPVLRRSASVISAGSAGRSLLAHPLGSCGVAFVCSRSSSVFTVAGIIGTSTLLFIGTQLATSISCGNWTFLTWKGVCLSP